jgi:hypothetical protein
MIASSKDQDEFDKQPPEWHEHLTKALLHHTGHGEHPGLYSPLKELAEEMGGTPDESELAKEQPTPPPEAMPPQPPPGGGKGRGGGKPPSQGTPTAIGESVVAPRPPEGEF